MSPGCKKKKKKKKKQQQSRQNKLKEETNLKKNVGNTNSRWWWRVARRGPGQAGPCLHGLVDIVLLRKRERERKKGGDPCCSARERERHITKHNEHKGSTKRATSLRRWDKLCFCSCPTQDVTLTATSGHLVRSAVLIAFFLSQMISRRASTRPLYGTTTATTTTA